MFVIVINIVLLILFSFIAKFLQNFTEFLRTKCYIHPHALNVCVDVEQENLLLLRPKKRKYYT